MRLLHFYKNVVLLCSNLFYMSTKNNLPFSDISVQKSELLRKITASIKGPLLRIYEIGVKRNCSHYKHAVRLCEYVLLSQPGKELIFDFDVQKTEKSQETFLGCGLTVEEKNEVFHLWVSMVELLRGYDGEEAQRHERFVIDFLYRLVVSFAGGKNRATFHIQKVVLFETYNMFLRDTKTVELPCSLTEKTKLRRFAKMPLV